jgi:cystathionine beta-lyase/cystathionine gamma-synthase
VKIHTQAVHAGDRKKPGAHIPAVTPIHTATSYFYDSMEQLDRVFAGEEPGYCYARFDNPSAAALEELLCVLEGGAAALACASGMAALHAALHEAFAALPPSGQRLIALLLEDPPASYTDISARLGIPVGSIGPTRRRCVNKLRRYPAVAALINTDTGSPDEMTAGQLRSDAFGQAG